MLSYKENYINLETKKYSSYLHLEFFYEFHLLLGNFIVQNPKLHHLQYLLF